MRSYQFGRPPAALQRRSVPLDNLALVPGSVLVFKEQWQRIANSLPTGHILIVLPSQDTPTRRILVRVASLLQANGHKVTTVPAEPFSR